MNLVIPFTIVIFLLFKELRLKDLFSFLLLGNFKSSYVKFRIQSNINFLMIQG